MVEYVADFNTTSYVKFDSGAKTFEAGMRCVKVYGPADYWDAPFGH